MTPFPIPRCELTVLVNAAVWIAVLAICIWAIVRTVREEMPFILRALGVEPSRTLPPSARQPDDVG